MHLKAGSEFERDEPVNKPVAKVVEAEEEVGSKPKKTVNDDDEGPEISTEMKRKLLRELRSQGGDANYSAGPILGNPILLISLVMTVLVILGGKDVFY